MNMNFILQQKGQNLFAYVDNSPHYYTITIAVDSTLMKVTITETGTLHLIFLLYSSALTFAS